MKHIVFIFALAAFLTSCNNSPSSDVEVDSETPLEEQETEVDNTEVEKENVPPQTVSFTVRTPGETMTTMKFEPERLEVPAGARVTLTLVNEAESEAMIHNFVLIRAGDQQKVVEAALKAGAEKDYIPDSELVLAATSLTQPGEESQVEFTAPIRKGTYQYICTYPGHTAMKGILLVK